MIFDRNENKPVIALLGAGAMGTAIVRRIAAGKQVLLGDVSQDGLQRVAHDLAASGYDVHTQQVDALDRESVQAFAAHAAELGEVRYFIDTAGASPNQSSPEHIVALDLVATAMAIDVFGGVISAGGAGLIISSQAGHMMRLSDETEQELARTPTEELAGLEFLKKDALVSSGVAYMVSKRANHLRVRTAAATTWGDRGARINTISPGVVVTPLAYDEFNAAGEGYQAMIDASPVRRVGTPDEIAAVAAFLLGEQAAFITGTDLLIDGGVIAALNSGRFSLGH
ncbi:MAG: SDR family oxidoreductase [Actinomycetaceae bacterium]|nr:SDR family oxidoreductase [Actinomycetaceae bacterium]